MFTPIAILLGFLYAAGMLLFALTLAKRKPSRDPAYRPAVSIIVAARNEEARIGACISSLLALSYPKDLLEVIIVDDHSTDLTQDVVRKHIGTSTGFRLIKAGEPAGVLKGKVNALVAGIDQSKGEILLFTDADCTVPAEWVEATVGYYADKQVAMVAGFITLSGQGWLRAIQSLDWLALVSAASATAALRFPVTAVGNNLSIRRSAYNEVGGYRNIPFSVTEDFALVKAVTTTGAGRVVLPLDAGIAIQTVPCRTMSELLSQRRRWFVGGRGMTASRVLAFAGIYLFHLALAAGVWLSDPLLWAALLAIKLTADYLLVLPALIALKQHRLTPYWLHFEVYLCLYVLILPVLALFRPRISWKGRMFGGSRTSP